MEILFPNNLTFPSIGSQTVLRSANIAKSPIKRFQYELQLFSSKSFNATLYDIYTIHISFTDLYSYCLSIIVLFVKFYSAQLWHKLFISCSHCTCIKYTKCNTVSQKKKFKSVFGSETAKSDIYKTIKEHKHTLPFV